MVLHVSLSFLTFEKIETLLERIKKKGSEGHFKMLIKPVA